MLSVLLGKWLVENELTFTEKLKLSSSDVFSVMFLLFSKLSTMSTFLAWMLFVEPKVWAQASRSVFHAQPVHWGWICASEPEEQPYSHAQWGWSLSQAWDSSPLKVSEDDAWRILMRKVHPKVGRHGHSPTNSLQVTHRLGSVPFLGHPWVSTEQVTPSRRAEEPSSTAS